MSAYPLYRSLFSADRASAAVRVLRSHEAPLVLCFLQENFKAGSYAPVQASDWLAGQLADFLETWNVSGSDDAGDVGALNLSFEDRAARHLKDWVRKGYLTLYTDERGTDQHTLTPELESALDWVASLLNRPTFVGTESRFLHILHQLRELVQNSADDWQVKVAELEEQKAALDRQIRELQLTRTVRPYEDYQIESRFKDVSGVARSLLRDFREVESNFRAITQRIYRQQAEADQTKGSLLGLALDALDELRLTPQGRSFEAFYQHLNDPRQQDELDGLVRQVFELLAARGLDTGDDFLRQIRRYLHHEGRKVNDSFAALARKLEKILSAKNLRDRRKSLDLINTIRGLAFEVIDQPPAEVAFLVLEGRANLVGTEARVELKEREASIKPRPLAVAAPTPDDIPLPTPPRVVDKAVLVANIQAMLREVVGKFGLKYGLSELLAYGSIAAASTRHLLNEQHRAHFDLGEGRSCEFPDLIFNR